MEELASIIKNKREKLNISIEEVSDAIKVRKNLLHAIENAEFEKLPSVYGKSFIKEYINFLRIPEEEYSDLLNEFIKLDSIKTKKANAAISNPNLGNLNTQNKSLLSIYFNNNYVNYLIYLALGLAVIGILYFSIFYHPESEAEQEIISNATDIDTTVISDNDENNLFNFFDKQDSISLEVFAIDTAWIKIDMDGKIVDEALMVPNSKRIWKAKEFFKIHQGNVGALKIKRNGKLLEPFGSPGSVAKNVKVTKTSVEKNTPWD